MGITVRYNKHLFLRLSVLFVCLLVGFTLFSQNTFAQGRGDGFAEVERRNSDTNSLGLFGGAEPIIDNTGSESSIVPVSNINGVGNEIVPTEETGGGDYSGPSGDNKVDSLIYNSSISLGGIVVIMAGWVFDLSIDRVVLKMGCWFRETPGGNCSGVQITGGIGGVVNALWIVIRDLFNILFIFSLIFIGLKTIWSPGDSSTKKALGLLIAAALLINFSLYVTKVIVDMSNYAAVAIHNQATQGMTGDGYGRRILNKETGEEIINITSGDKKSLSGAYMQALQFSGWFTSDLRNQSTGKIITFSLMFLLTSIIVAIVFFWGGIMLITRFIALIIFMIFSPAMFLGWVLPQFQKYTSQWWSKFLSYAFFAPAYIFMLYLGLYTLLQLEASFVSSSKATYAEALSDAGDGFAIFLFFAIGIAFLVAATKVGESMSIAGAGTTMATLKGVKNKIQGGGGRIISDITGSYYQRKLNQIDIDDARRGRTTVWSRARRARAEKGLGRRYGSPTSRKERVDARKTSDARAARGHAVNQLQNDLRAGGQTASTAIGKATSAQLEELAKSRTGRGLLITYAEHLSKNQIKTLVNSKEDSITDNFKTTLANTHETNTNNRLLSNLGGTPGSPTSEITNLRKANKDQLESIGVAGLSTPTNASKLTKKQIDLLEELKNDGKIQDTEFTTIKDTREAVLTSVANGTPVTGAPTRNNMLNSGDAIPDLPQNALIGLAPDLSKASLRKIAEKSENSKQVAVRRALIGSRSPVKPPIDPTTGKMIESGDPRWTSHHDIWEFLFRDNVGKNLGT